MPNRTMLTRTALAGVAAALIAAPGASAMQDARGEAAAGTSTHPADLRSLPQDEAWLDRSTPVHPRAVPTTGGDGGGGVDVPIVMLAVAGTLAVAGGMAVAANLVETRAAL